MTREDHLSDEDRTVAEPIRDEGVAATGDDDPSQDAGTAAAPGEVDRGAALLPADDADQMRLRWHELQAGFVDDPRKAADEAAELVSRAADRVSSIVNGRIEALDEARLTGSSDGDDTATEQLRTLMQRYRVLLDRVLAV